MSINSSSHRDEYQSAECAPQQSIYVSLRSRRHRRHCRRNEHRHGRSRRTRSVYAIARAHRASTSFHRRRRPNGASRRSRRMGETASRAAKQTRLATNPRRLTLGFTGRQSNAPVARPKREAEEIRRNRVRPPPTAVVWSFSFGRIRRSLLENTLPANLRHTILARSNRDAS